MEHITLQKKFGLSLLLVPVAFLLFFGIGEMMKSFSAGFIHFVQLVPLAILFIIALFSAEWAGYLLIIIGSLLGVLYLITTQFPLPTILLVEFMLFVMPVVSGVLLVISHKDKPK